MTGVMRPLLPRLQARTIEKPGRLATPCWVWTGGGAASNPWGYGTISYQGRQMATHRAAYIELVGQVPEGLVLDHLCDNPPCWRPDHLEPKTHRANVLRGNGWSGRNARKTHCPAGHEYSDANTHITRRGERKCRKCHAFLERKRRARLKAVKLGRLTRVPAVQLARFLGETETEGQG